MADTRRYSSKVCDLSDSIFRDVAAARAIMDAAKVLTALERVRAKSLDGCLQTGEGMADGHALRDDTLPTLLAHGVELLNRIEAQTEAMSKAAQAPLREVANA